jgi:hypothetical protein
MKMRKREVLELLNRALVDAHMERAAFSQLHPKGPFPTSEAEVDKFIKDRTRLYRESWIIGPLKQAIKLIEQDGKKRAQL